jgi:hypothetical protein
VRSDPRPDDAAPRPPDGAEPPADTTARELADLPATPTGLAGTEVPPGVHAELAPDPAELAAARRAAADQRERADVEPAEPPAPPRTPPVVDVRDLAWADVRERVDPGAVRARMRQTVERLEALLDQDGGPGLLFDADRADADDRAIQVRTLDDAAPLWFIGDLHGDLLALESALALIAREADASAPPRAAPRIVFLGDLFDDGGHGLEVLLRVFELLIERPGAVCVLAGNHDEALGFNGAHFTATVSPSDFSEFLNTRLAHEWVVRAGKLAVRLFAQAPRALFFPDGLLVSHGGFPLADLHASIAERGDWNCAQCLIDFVWTRAHPRARKKMPNRASRGSQFGYEDFAAFCALATRLGRPVTHLVRGHDHVDERYEIYEAYAAHPVLTTNALSRRLDREAYGPYERVPTIARWVDGALPQVHRLHVPPELVREVMPEPTDDGGVETGG